MDFETRLEQAKLDALAEFAAGAGHEINNPLAIISGHAQTLLHEITDESHRRSLAVIAAQAKRAYEMIADLRVFARPPKPEYQEFDLVAMLEEVIASDAGAGVPVEYAGVPAKCLIVSDSVQLRVVFAALLKNAAEAGANAIEIALHVEETGIRVHVDDNGSGIPESIRPYIFCPYYSGRQANRGLGFGLPKAWQLIRQLGGSISTEPLPTGSTRFSVILPKNQ